MNSKRPTRRTRSAAGQINLMPLLDVVFILLIFFAVSTSLLNTNKGLQLNLPSAKTSKANPNGIYVSINSQHKVYYDGKRIGLRELTNAIHQDIVADPSKRVILQADQSVLYETVVTVMDAIRAGGGTRLILETRPK